MIGENNILREPRRDQTLVGLAPIILPEGTTPLDGGAREYRLGVRINDSGEIYEGHHPRISTPFVIKLFRRSAGESSAAVKAFSTEAGRISILRHPNIAQVIDSGMFVDRTPFLAVDRLVGRTLDERMAALGPLPLPEVYAVIRGVALALSAAHTAGIVHREIRPDNIFICEGSDGDIRTVKVLDFGVSRLTWGLHSAGRGISLKAARYLPPEQERGGFENVDASADQFAFAALTHQLLAEGRSAPLLADSRAGAAIEAILSKALSSRPTDRFSSVGRFFHAIEESLVQQGLQVPISSGPRKGNGSVPAPQNGRNVTYRDKRFTNRVSDAGENAETRTSSLARRDAVSQTDSGVGADRVPRHQAPLIAMALVLATVATGFAARGEGWRVPRAWRELNIPFAAFVVGTKFIPRPAVTLPSPSKSIVTR